MEQTILKINLSNELDVVLAYRRAIQLSERLGVTLASQTKFGTAVSEVCRNVVEHVGMGMIQFNIVEDNGLKYLEALVSDRGRGIANLDAILDRASKQQGSKGCGLYNSRKLVDFFEVQSEADKGTRVTLRRRIPANAPAFSKKMLEQWVQDFDQDVDISPYAEIKRQNMQLLDLLEELRLRHLEVQQQLQEIRRLNSQLQFSNREIQELLDERDKKNQLLQKINEDLDAFAHTISHDLRSPLQNITGLTNVLEACLENDKPRDARQVFPMLREQANKMDRLITNVLAYSLAGQQSLPKQVVDVQALLQQVISSLYVPRSIHILIPEHLPLLYTEEVYLFQVFSNLIGNALKYHDHPEEGHISVLFHPLDDFLRFAVEDDGPGIPAENQVQLFKRYGGMQLKSFRPDSSGLGLSIVDRIVKKKEGKVWVESESRGTRMVFTWPASEVVN
jgi:signal transduction histidine kinase